MEDRLSKQVRRTVYNLSRFGFSVDDTDLSYNFVVLSDKFGVNAIFSIQDLTINVLFQHEISVLSGISLGVHSDALVWIISSDTYNFLQFFHGGSSFSSVAFTIVFGDCMYNFPHNSSHGFRFLDQMVVNSNASLLYAGFFNGWDSRLMDQCYWFSKLIGRQFLNFALDNMEA